MASYSADKTLKIWNAREDFALVKSFDAAGVGLSSLASLPNGDLIYGTENGSIRALNPSKHDALGESELVLNEPHAKRVTFLLILPNGDLASASEDSTIKIWTNSN